eukprot:7388806-Alexandrium_andersonii.AAC.1
MSSAELSSSKESEGGSDEPTPSTECEGSSDELTPSMEGGEECQASAGTLHGVRGELGRVDALHGGLED